MKTPVYLSILVMFAFFANSCTKSNLSELDDNSALQNQDPYIEANIFHAVNEPFETELGTPSAVFRQGNEVVVYVPYVMVNDMLQESTITMIDNGTAQEIETWDMTSSTDASAKNLNKPVSLLDDTFMFIRFTVDDRYTNKNISLRVTLNGSVVTSQFTMDNAFSVVP